MGKHAAIAAALLFGASSLALAQGDTTPAPGDNPRAGASPTGGADAVEPPAVSGSSMRMTPADVKALLEREGYAQVSDVAQGSGGYTASAVKDGAPIELLIDAEGRIKARSP
jgi:hypothetical protein